MPNLGSWPKCGTFWWTSLGAGHIVEGVGSEKLGVDHYFSTCQKGWARKNDAVH